MLVTRRRFFGLMAAPAIVRATSIMPVRVFETEYSYLGLAPLKAEGAEVIFDRQAIRDLLFPGLRIIQGSYTDLPSQWSKMFASGGFDAA